jgi:hypothetical protein
MSTWDDIRKKQLEHEASVEHVKGIVRSLFEAEARVEVTDTNIWKARWRKANQGHEVSGRGDVELLEKLREYSAAAKKKPLVLGGGVAQL